MSEYTPIHDLFQNLLKDRNEVKKMSSNMTLKFIDQHANDIPWDWISISRRIDVWSNKNAWFRRKYKSSLMFGW